MASLAPLLKVQMLGAFGIGRLMNEHDAKSRRKCLLFAAAAALLVVLAAVYMAAVGSTLVAMRATDALPCLAVAISSTGCLFSTFFKAGGLLFGFKDFDQVVSAPVATRVVVLSRIVPLYGMGLALSAILGAPLLGAYLGAVPATPERVAACAAAIVFAPAAPMALSVGLSFCVALIASRTPFAQRRFGIVGVIGVSALVVGIMAVAGGTNATGGESTQALAASMAEAEGAMMLLWPPAAWAKQAIVEENPAFLALFCGFSIAAAAGATGVLSRFLVPLNSLLRSNRGTVRRNEDGRKGGVRTPLRALVVKELRAWVNTPIYFMNTGIGAVLLLVVSAAAVISGPDAIASIVNIPGLDRELLAATLARVLPWALAFCAAMTAMSASATSLEGGARQIALTAPVPAAAIIGAKILANLAVVAPASIVGGAFASIGLARTPLEAALFVAAPLALGVFVSCFGGFLDTKNPRFDWTSEYEPVKRSANMGICIAGGLALTFAGAGATLAAQGFGAAVGVAYSTLVFALGIIVGKKATALPLWRK